MIALKDLLYFFSYKAVSKSCSKKHRKTFEKCSLGLVSNLPFYFLKVPVVV